MLGNSLARAVSSDLSMGEQDVDKYLAKSSCNAESQGVAGFVILRRTNCCRFNPVESP